MAAGALGYSTSALAAIWAAAVSAAQAAWACVSQHWAASLELCAAPGLTARAKAEAIAAAPELALVPVAALVALVLLMARLLPPRRPQARHPPLPPTPSPACPQQCCAGEKLPGQPRRKPQADEH